MRRNVLGNIFRIQGQHPDLPLPRAEKVDDPDTPALAAPGHAPAQLANASGAGTTAPASGFAMRAC